MRVVPVLDVRGGRAVHAAGGKRSGYPPLSRRFPALSDDPLETVGRLRARWGDALYVADLDALEGGETQWGLLDELAASGARLWVDAGVRDPGRARRLAALGSEQVIVALETLPRWSLLGRVAALLGPERVAFGLDLRGGRPVSRLEGPSTAPSVTARARAEGAGRILVLALEMVGSEAGPDLETVRRCRRAAGPLPLAYGGGVRGARDLEALARAGVTECLVGTALHAESIEPGDVPPGDVPPGDAGAGAQGPASGAARGRFPSERHGDPPSG